MSGKNWQLVLDEPVEVQDFMKFNDHFRETYRIYLKWMKQNRKMSNMEPVGFRITKVEIPKAVNDH